MAEASWQRLQYVLERSLIIWELHQTTDDELNHFVVLFIILNLTNYIYIVYNVS